MDRLQKVMAHAGVASRRKCEELIRSGRVKINGETCTELGVQVDVERVTISVDDNVIELEPKTCLLLHKPTSCVTTVSDPEGRRTVMDFVDSKWGRVYPVGRLDYDTSGLLLLTNDGDLANRMMHPSFKVAKTYRATILGMPDKSGLKLLAEGVPLEDGVTGPATIKVLRNHPMESVVEITIAEGRNRQVRRMFEHIGNDVKRLKRISYGPLELGALAPSKSRLLTEAEWRAIYGAVGLPNPPWPGSVSKSARKPSTPSGRQQRRLSRPKKRKSR